MNTTSSRPHNPVLPSVLSLVIPGAGQFYLGNRTRGAVILVTTLIGGALIYWTQDNYRVALGDTTAILDQLAQYPFCGFELDYKTDAQRAKATVGADHVLCGNVDPSGIIAHGTPTALLTKGTVRDARGLTSST